MIVLDAVTPFYPLNGSKWNDYVDNDGSSRLAATDNPCSATGNGYGTCIHGGEMRLVAMPSKLSCIGLSAYDALGVFQWTCDDNLGSVRIISTGLAPGARLSDLIDFSGPGWRANSVTVLDGGLPYAATVSSNWWTNALVVDNDGGSLSTSGTIYLATQSANAAYTMDADRVGLVVEPSVTLKGPGAGTGSIVVFADSRTFIWFEGKVNAAGDDGALRWTAVDFSVIRGAGLFGSDAAWPSGCLHVHGGSHNNHLSHIVAANCEGAGLIVDAANHNTFSHVRVVNNGNLGVFVSGENNIMLHTIAGNNAGRGVQLTYADGHGLLNATAANNGDDGIAASLMALKPSLVNLVSVNSANYGVYVDANDSTVANVVATNNTVTGVHVESFGNYFTGLLKAGNNGFDCYGGSGQGLWTDCNPEGPSDFGAPAMGCSLTTSFVAKVGTGGTVDTTDDDVNTSDSNGTALYPSITDWTGFENDFRGWGLDGSAFTHTDHQGRCVGPSVDCRIWDWSATTGDLGDPNGGGPSTPGPVLYEVLPLPSGNDTLVHYWKTSATSQGECEVAAPGSSYFADNDCRTTHLRNAIEILGDGIGNENGLCESVEQCLHTPNIGSYQGHGPLVSAGAFTDGTLTAITLLRHQSNGY